MVGRLYQGVVWVCLKKFALEIDLVSQNEDELLLKRIGERI
jgi:hypothetical protein